MSSIILTGNGKDRNVQMGPSTIDLGDGRRPAHAPVGRQFGQVLSIDNLDDLNIFQIREIKIRHHDGRRALELVSSVGNSDLIAPAPASTTSGSACRTRATEATAVLTSIRSDAPDLGRDPAARCSSTLTAAAGSAVRPGAAGRWMLLILGARCSGGAAARLPVIAGARRTGRPSRSRRAINLSVFTRVARRARHSVQIATSARPGSAAARLHRTRRGNSCSTRS
jgi:hypothetical protein